MASAAAKVGSSRFAAGVPVLDLDRLVDFPNDPVSATALRGLTTVGFPSLLEKSGRTGISGGIAQELETDLEKYIAYGLCIPSSPTYSSSSGTLCSISGAIPTICRVRECAAIGLCEGDGMQARNILAGLDVQHVHKFTRSL
jgi:hypothetical protein